MKRRLPRRGLVLLVVAYAAATWWVFTRSAPIVATRPVTLRVAHWQIEKGPPEGLAAVIRRYEEINPRVRVETVAVPSSIYRQWLRTNLTGGTGADIVEFGYFLGGVEDLPTRYFEPLTAVMEQPNPYNRGTSLAQTPWRNTFSDGLYVMTSLSPEIGQVYGVTLSQGSSRLFCNVDLLRTITGTTEGPRTWIELRTLAAKVNDFARRTGRPLHTLAGSQSNAQWLMETLMRGCVAKLNLELDRDGLLERLPAQVEADYLEGRWSARRPELRAAYALLRETCQWMRPGFEQLGRDSAVQEFVRGEALFIYSGTFDATSIRRLAPFPVELMHMPQLTRDDPVAGEFVIGPYLEALVGTGVEFYLNKDGPHKTEALDFMRFLTSIEGGELFMNHSGWLSATREVRTPPELEIQRAANEGYHTGVFYMGIGQRSVMAFKQNLHLLVSPQGGVDSFVDAFETGMRALMTEDFQMEIRSRLRGIRAVDAEIAALDALRRLRPADPARREQSEVLLTNQTLAEQRVYEATAVLARAGVDQAPRRD